ATPAPHAAAGPNAATAAAPMNQPMIGGQPSDGNVIFTASTRPSDREGSSLCSPRLAQNAPGANQFLLSRGRSSGCLDLEASAFGGVTEQRVAVAVGLGGAVSRGSTGVHFERVLNPEFASRAVCPPLDDDDVPGRGWGGDDLGGGRL